MRCEKLSPVYPIVSATQILLSMGKLDKTIDLKVSSVSTDPSVVVGAFFNGLEIPKNTLFDLYKHPSEDEYLLHGENSTLEYNGLTLDNQDNKDYVVALYDPKQKSVELYKSPLVQTRVTSIDSRVHKGPKIKSRGTRYADQKMALGQEFGTKKAKAAIASLARNRIDLDKLQDLEMDIVDLVKEVTATLPLAQEIQEASSENKVVPPVNVDATNVEDIYALEGIVPANELASIRVGPFLEESDPDARLQLMPYSKSAFVARHLDKLVHSSNEKKLQMLYYASLLMGVYNNRRCKDKATLMEKLGNIPSEFLIDGILKRFTAHRRGDLGKAKDRSFFFDTHHEDKLFCYLLALMFHIEGFFLELNPLSKELNLKPSKLTTLLRALGAKIRPATVGMAEALGIPKKDASTYKIAELKVPFTPPEMVSRRRR